MTRSMAFLTLLILSGFAFAQRPGSIEAGGYISFNSYSTENQDNNSLVLLDGFLAYNVKSKMVVDILPQFQLDFLKDSVHVSTRFFTSLSFHLVDMTPGGYRRTDYLYKDMGVSSAVFAAVGGGVWLDGISLSGTPGKNYAGPAVMASIGTHSSFGKWARLRTKLQFSYLLPAGDVYNKGRSIIQFALGFGVMIKP